MVSRPLPTLLAALVATGCAPPPGGEAPGPCGLTAWVRPTVVAARHGLGQAALAEPELVGSWDGWATPGRRGFGRYVDEQGPSWRYLPLALPPGRYDYAIRFGEALVLDEANPHSAYLREPIRGLGPPWGVEVSTVDLRSCGDPGLELVALRRGGEGRTLHLVLRPRLGEPPSPIAPGSLTATVTQGGLTLPGVAVTVGESGECPGCLSLGVTVPGPGKYTVAAAARDSGGRRAVLRASAFAEPGEETTPPLGDGLVYQIIVDRFRGPGPLAPPLTPGRRAGGTLDGVREAVEAGYFERLGVTTLWLSPLYENPPGLFRGRDGHDYEAYHGYWPSAPRTVDPRLGGDAALSRLVRAAHRRGIRMVADAVPNHVHAAHPYYLAHSRRAPAVAGAADPSQASWFNDAAPDCLCGLSCPWDEQCWFDRYLPDLNLRHPDAAAQIAADLAYWVDHFDLDGLRLDAVPLMPRPAVRRFARAVRATALRQGLDGLLLGETFTAPGDGGRAEIRSYLGLAFDGLDSQFDFPLLWATRAAFARDAIGLDELEREVEAGRRAYLGSGATMAHFIDNHDTSRFLSEATGDGAGDPWRAPPAQPTDEGPYRRTALALAFALTLPGLPVLYYGDEVGLAGGGDPDARRVLPDVLGGRLAPPQAWLLEVVGRIGRLRRCAPALRRGERHLVAAGADFSVAVRQPPGAEGEAAIVVLSRAAAPSRRLLGGLPDGEYRDALGGGTLRVEGGRGEVPLPPRGVAVYLPATSHCLK